MGLFDFLGGGKSNYAISLDIGTEFVKSLIYEIKDNRANIIGIGKKRQKLSDMHGGTVTDIKGVIRNCEEALAQAQDMAGILPEQVIIGIAGELVKGTTTTVEYTRAEPNKKIDFEELQHIVDKVQDRAYRKSRDKIAEETGQKNINIKLVNAAIVDVIIDGVKIANPVGFQGKNMAIGIYNSFAPVVHLGALQTVAEELGLDLLSVAAEPYAVARSVGLEEDSDFSGIFMDIGGGTTDIAVVRNGCLEGTKMFALGGRTFTRRLSQILDISYETAEDIKLSYSAGKLDDKSTAIVKDALGKDCGVWLSGVELILEDFENIDLLPAKILLCGGASALPDIIETLHGEDWGVNLPFAKRPKIDFIRIPDVVGIHDVTGRLEDPQDITPLALASLSLDFAGKEGVLEGILRKSIQSLRE